MTYATLSDVLSEGKVESNLTNPLSSEVIDGKAYLLEALHFVTRRIDVITQQEFAPRRQKRYFDTRPDMTIDAYLNSLVLDRPLLDVVQVKIADSILTQWTPDLPYSDRVNYDYFLYPVNTTPHSKLQATKVFPTWSLFFWSPFAFYPQATQQALSIDGLWAYREYYNEQGYLSSGQTVQNNPLSSTGTALTVASTAPFSAGMWLRFADGATPAQDEICEVAAVVGNTSVTIVRGGEAARGTTPTSHAQNCPIDIWQPDPNIVRAAQRWAAHLYARRTVYETMRVNMGASGSVTQIFPQDAPEEVSGILGAYTNWHLARA